MGLYSPRIGVATKTGDLRYIAGQDLRKPGSLRGDAKPVRDLMRDLERVNRGEP